jgi:hypothetical protein
MTIAQPLLPFLYNSTTFRVKQLNRQLEEVYGKIILRSSITWIAFPFSLPVLLGPTDGSRVVFAMPEICM